MKYCDEASEIDPSFTAALDLKREAIPRIYDSNDDLIAKIGHFYITVSKHCLYASWIKDIFLL